MSDPRNPQQPGYPPQGQPGQQPPYGGQPGQPPYGGQPGQPPYGPPPGQPGYGYPPGQQPPGQQPGWGGPPQQPGYGQFGAPPFGQPPKKSNTQIILLAVGGLALVAIIGIVLALFLGGDDEPEVGPSVEPTNTQPTGEPTGDPTGEPTSDPTGEPTGEPTSNPTGEPTGQPTSEPTGEPTGGDKGIEAGEGVYVNPAPGYIRKSDGKTKGVYLLKQGEATFWLEVVKDPGKTGTQLLAEIVEEQKTGLQVSGFRTGSPSPKETNNPKVTAVNSQTWGGTITTQSGAIKLVGLVAVIERDDKVVSVVRFVSREDKVETSKVDMGNMYRSVIASQ